MFDQLLPRYTKVTRPDISQFFDESIWGHEFVSWHCRICMTVFVFFKYLVQTQQNKIRHTDSNLLHLQ